MDKITIYSADKSRSITLPRVRDIEVGAEEESKTVTMASGKTVKDILGYRTNRRMGLDTGRPGNTAASVAEKRRVSVGGISCSRWKWRWLLLHRVSDPVGVLLP